MLTLTFDPFPFLVTNRLALRKISQNDVDEMLFMRSDSRVMKYIDKAPCKSKDEAGEFITKILTLEKNNDAVTWAITIKHNTKLIGTICFWNMKKENYRAEIGYALHPDYHGRGVMNEAMSEVLDFGFQNMNLHSVEANVNPENIASIKLLERNGFVREGYFKENFYYNGKFLDSAIYSKLTPLR